MDDASFEVLIRNLGALLFVALPLTVLAMMLKYMWLVEGATGWTFPELALIYATAFLPTAFGGGFHHLVLWFLRNRRRRSRKVAAGTSPVVLIVFVAGLTSWGFLVENLLPIVCGLLAYAVLVRPFPDPLIGYE